MSAAGGSDERLRALLLEYIGRRRTGAEIDPEAFVGEHPEQADRLRPILMAVSKLSADRAEAYIGEMLGAFEGGSAAAPDGGRTMQLPDAAPVEELYDRRYRVLEVLGEGGFGRVYKVEDSLNPGTMLALKEVLAEHQDSDRFERRFRTEIQVQRKLSHPGIPQVFNDGKTEAGAFYYTMAYVEGTTLEEVLKRDAPLEPERVVRLVQQVLGVLEYAHGEGVVHRDLKPLNIVITGAGSEDERVHVLDFGIAKIIGQEAKIEHTLTMESAGPMGSPDYMSPEQVRGVDVDASTDLYALGVIIYRMVTAELPFSGKTLMEALTARLDRDPPALDEKTVPPWLASVVKELLAREKTQRPSTSELQNKLNELAEGQHHLRRRQNAALVIVGLVVLVAAVIVVAVALPPEDDPAGQVPVVSGPDDRTQTVAGSGLAFTTPADKDHVKTRTVWVRGTAIDAEQVTVRAVARGSSVEVKKTPPVDSNAFGTELSLDEGWWTISLFPGTGEGQATAECELLVDFTEPTIVPVGGLPGTALDGGERRLLESPKASFELSVKDLSPGELATVSIDGSPQQITSDGRYSAAVDLSSAPSQSVRLLAVDKAGNESTFESTFELAGDAPAVELGGPSKSSADGKVTLEAGLLRGRRELVELELVRLDVEREVDAAALFGAEGARAIESSGAALRGLEVPVGLTRFVLLARDPLGRYGHAEHRVERLPTPGSPTYSGGGIQADLIPGAKIVLPASADSVRITGSADAPLAAARIGEISGTVDGELYAFELTPDASARELTLQVVHEGSGLESDPLRFTLSRAAATVPEGCVALAGGVDTDGRARTIQHKGTGVRLALVEGSSSGLRKVEPFYLGKFELSRSEYEKGGGSVDGHGEPLLPIAGISITEARQFCDRNELRLPTVQEWVWAARGEEDRPFPWAGPWTEGNANLRADGDDHERAAPIDAFPADESWCGVVGMCGNVSEWCEADRPEAVTYRGGNHRSKAPTGTDSSSLFLGHDGPNPGLFGPDTRNDQIGLRVALDAAP